eukprot:4574940-Lingulodinium_polyedra.AAC.1
MVSQNVALAHCRAPQFRAQQRPARGTCWPQRTAHTPQTVKTGPLPAPISNMPAIQSPEAHGGSRPAG